METVYGFAPSRWRHCELIYNRNAYGVLKRLNNHCENITTYHLADMWPWFDKDGATIIVNTYSNFYVFDASRRHYQTGQKYTPYVG